MTDILDLTIRIVQGRHITKAKSPQLNAAVTKPGERWHLNEYCMTSVIVVRDGPAPNGHNYADGVHKLTVARFETVRDAAAGVQAFNGFNVIADMWKDDLSPRDFHDRVGELLRVYGRI